jgi:hypothetical protein
MSIRKGDKIEAVIPGTCQVGTRGECIAIGSIDSEEYLKVLTEDGNVFGPILADNWKRRDMSLPVDPRVSVYLEGVIGVVEATGYESLALWKFHHEEHKESWISGTIGYSEVVGYINERPVCVTLTVNVVRGQPVLFLEASSQIVDHQMIKDWLLKALPRTAFRKNYNDIPGEHINMVDSMNFCNVFRN